VLGADTIRHPDLLEIKTESVTDRRISSSLTGGWIAFFRDAERFASSNRTRL
jgi:hypothetical protein